MAPETPKLPALEERLPELLAALQALLAVLPDPALPPLPAWENLYMIAHGLKGLVGILPCQAGLAAFLPKLSDELRRLCNGEYVLPGQECAEKIEALCLWLENQTWKRSTYSLEWLKQIRREPLSAAPFAPPLNESPELQHRWQESRRLGYVPLIGQLRCTLEQLPDERRHLQKTLQQSCGPKGFLLYSQAVLGGDGDRIFLSYAIACQNQAMPSLSAALKDSGHTVQTSL